MKMIPLCRAAWPAHIANCSLTTEVQNRFRPATGPRSMSSIHSRSPLA